MHKQMILFIYILSNYPSNRLSPLIPAAYLVSHLARGAQFDLRDRVHDPLPEVLGVRQHLGPRIPPAALALHHR